MQTVLLYVSSRKESNTPEYCTLINELLYATWHFSSVSQNRVTSLHKTQVHTCNNTVGLLMLPLGRFWQNETLMLMGRPLVCWLPLT